MSNKYKNNKHQHLNKKQLLHLEQSSDVIQ